MTGPKTTGHVIQLYSIQSMIFRKIQLGILRLFEASMASRVSYLVILFKCHICINCFFLLTSAWASNSLAWKHWILMGKVFITWFCKKKILTFLLSKSWNKWLYIMGYIEWNNYFKIMNGLDQPVIFACACCIWKEFSVLLRCQR